jgi:hypothetical protein
MIPMKQEHLIRLYEESGLQAETVLTAGVISSDRMLSKKLFGMSHPGIGFPYYNLSGALIGYRLKLEKPLKDVKYLQKKGTNLHVFFHRLDLLKIKNPEIPLVITEGEKKALALGQVIKDQAVLSIPGCWNWKESGRDGLASIWKDLPLQGRPVFFYPDSDFFFNPKVWKAGQAFVGALLKRGARVSLFPLGSGEEKIGADDFLLQKGVDAFLGLKPVFVGESWESLKSPMWANLYRGERLIRELIWDRTYQSVVDLYKMTGLVLSDQTDLYLEEDKLVSLSIGEEREYLDTPERLSQYLGMRCEFQMGVRSAKGQLILNHDLLPNRFASGFLFSKKAFLKRPPVSIYSKSPIFIENQGLIYQKGYDDKTGAFYNGPDLTPRKTMDHIKALLAFPFEDPVDWVNALGALIGAVFLRPSFPGSHPAFLIQGDGPDVGKSTLAEFIAQVANLNHRTMSYTKDDGELEKTIASNVYNGCDFIVIDNIRGTHTIASSVLERTLTDEFVNFRRLGASQTISRKNTIQLVFTINNGSFSPDLIARSLPIRLSSFGEKGKIKPDIKALKLPVLEELIGMVELWIEKGFPEAQVSFPKYPRYGAIVGGILEANGISGFLSNLSETKNDLDIVTRSLLEVVACELEAGDATSKRSSGEWLERLVAYNPRCFEEGSSPRAKTTKLGLLMGKMVGCRYRVSIGEEEQRMVECCREADFSAGGINKVYYFKF